MIRLYAFIAIIFAFSGSALAQSAGQNTLCDKVGQLNRPVAGAGYVPGVDVDGNPVEGANINDHSAFMPDVIKVPVVIDLAERLGFDLPDGTQMEAPIQTVEIHKDSRIMMNGQDITSQTNSLCSELNVIHHKSEREVLNPHPHKDILNPHPERDILTGKSVRSVTPRPPSTPAIKHEDNADFIWGEGY